MMLDEGGLIICYNTLCGSLLFPSVEFEVRLPLARRGHDIFRFRGVDWNPAIGYRKAVYGPRGEVVGHAGLAGWIRYWVEGIGEARCPDFRFYWAAADWDEEEEEVVDAEELGYSLNPSDTALAWQIWKAWLDLSEAMSGLPEYERLVGDEGSDDDDDE